MTKSEACTILGIDPNRFTRKDVNLAITKFHPDTAGKVTVSREKWSQAFEAYKFLKTMVDSVVIDLHQYNVTDDGKLITELGKGLNTGNAIDCVECESNGYTSYEETEYDTCETCRGSGAVIYSNGKYIPAKFFGNKACICPSCDGSGDKLNTERVVTRHRTCFKCKGVGQLPVLNPAFKDLGKMLASRR